MTPNKPIVVATGVALALLVLACGTEGPAEPVEFSLPALSDAIPYEALGSGRIVFARVGPYPGEYRGIYVVDIDSQRSWAFNPYYSQPPDAGLGDPGFFIAWRGPSVSPDGTRIAFRGGSEVHVVDIDGENLVCVSCSLDRQRGIPSWTPDGSQVYFWADGVLYAQSPVANPTDRQIVVTAEFYRSPRVSVGPTGAVILAWSVPLSDSVSVQGIFAIEQGTSEPRPLIADTVVHTTAPEDIHTSLGFPVWSPDGTRIAYLILTEGYGTVEVADSLVVMVAASDGTSRTSLLRRAAPGTHWCSEVEHSITWSPDGSRLLFNLPEGDLVSHLYLINADGSGLRAVTTEPGVSDRSPSWSR